MHGPVYLVASGEGAVLKTVARRALAAIAGTKKPTVAVTYAPVEGDRRGLKPMSERMPKLFPGAALETLDKDRSVVDRADLIFVSGGDPTHGAKVLAQTGAGAWIKEAAARGTPTMGVSAGAILLGDWWVDWPEDDDAPLEHAKLVACIGVLDGHTFDTHDEADGWQELHAAGKLLQAAGKRSKLIGIPTGGALVWKVEGGFEVVGNPPFQHAQGLE
jgi:putative intracellular protease/amidase